MTTRNDLDLASPEFDRLMTAWFDAEARVHEPVDLFDRTIARTARTRPRPAWLLPERWIPMELTMRRTPLPSAARYGALLVAIVLIAAVAFAIVGSQRRVPAPFGVAANGVVVYKTASGDIATVDPATGLTTTIVGGPEPDLAPTFSRDGTRVAFLRQVAGGNEVYVVDVSSHGLTRLTNGPLSVTGGPIWSPDGTRVAFVSADHLWIAKTDGSVATQLDTGDVVPFELAWRPPDGRALMFVGTQSGKSRLFMIEPDGAGLQRVGQFDGGDMDGQWLTPSPDGRRMAFGAFPAKQIHVVTIDGGIDQIVAPDDSIGLNFPRWSPDGASIAALQVPEGDLPATRIAVFAASDLSPHLTLTGPTFQGGVQFEWSPDGKTVLANQWGTDDTWTLDPAGGPGTRNSWRAAIDWVEWQRLAP
jgi:dipeptidyl aminopeptidase/acylaminoacyl peptidase